MLEGLVAVDEDYWNVKLKLSEQNCVRQNVHFHELEWDALLNGSEGTLGLFAQLTTWLGINLNSHERRIGTS
jgi:hypothetical protein